MPIYAYQCGACGHEVDLLQKMSDPPAVQCPACGANALSKQLTAAGFRLKGGGWYETDFKAGKTKRNLAGDKDGDGKKDDKPDKGDKKADKSGSETKSADKPATKKATSGDKPTTKAKPSD